MDLKAPDSSCLGRKDARLLQGGSGMGWGVDGNLGSRGHRFVVAESGALLGGRKVEKEVTSLHNQLGRRQRAEGLTPGGH